MATNVPTVDVSNTGLTELKRVTRTALLYVMADTINALRPNGQVQFTKIVAPSEVPNG